MAMALNFIMLLLTAFLLLDQLEVSTAYPVPTTEKDLPRSSRECQCHENGQAAEGGGVAGAAAATFGNLMNTMSSAKALGEGLWSSGIGLGQTLSGLDQVLVNPETGLKNIGGGLVHVASGLTDTVGGYLGTVGGLQATLGGAGNIGNAALSEASDYVKSTLVG